MNKQSLDLLNPIPLPPFHHVHCLTPPRGPPHPASVLRRLPRARALVAMPLVPDTAAAPSPHPTFLPSAVTPLAPPCHVPHVPYHPLSSVLPWFAMPLPEKTVDRWENRTAMPPPLPNTHTLSAPHAEPQTLSDKNPSSPEKKSHV